MCRLCGLPALGLCGVGWGNMIVVIHPSLKRGMGLQNLLKVSMWLAAVGGAGGHLPSVTIEYCGVEIEADALVGKDSIPSLTNAFWHYFKVSVACSAGLGAQETPTG